MKTRWILAGLVGVAALIGAGALAVDPAVPDTATPPSPPSVDASLPDSTLTETTAADAVEAVGTQPMEPAVEEPPLAITPMEQTDQAAPSVPAPAIEPAADVPPVPEDVGTEVEPVVEGEPGAAPETLDPPTEPVVDIEGIPGTAIEEPAVEVSPQPVQPVPGAPAAGRDSIVLTAEEKLPADANGREAEPEETNLITVTLDEVELQDVVRMFTRISGANIIASGTNLQGRVTVNLVDVEWKPALIAILDMHNLSLVEKIPGSEVYSIVNKPPDAPEPQLTETIFLRYASVSNVLAVVTPLLGKGKSAGQAVPFAARNALVVRATADNLKDIKDIVKRIDQPRQQVFIEAKFVELNDSAIKNLGVNWQMLQNFSVTASGLKSSYSETHRRSKVDSQGAVGGQLQSRTRTQTLQDNHPVAGTDVGSYGYGADVGEMLVSGNNITDIKMGKDGLTMESIVPFESQEIRTAILSMSDFKVVLSALKELDGVDIVSNPKIIVANEERATIHIGEKEPNIRGETTTPESGAPVTTYNLDSTTPYFEFGIQLEVIPTVNTENNITVHIMPSLTRFVKDKTAPDGNSFPVVARKEIRTLFTLESGHTVAIGGLTESRDRDATKKVPLLGDIPLIGKYLFSHTQSVKEQSETIIFVTVGLANPDTLIRESGIPDKARLIHRHMAKEALVGEKLE